MQRVPSELVVTIAEFAPSLRTVVSMRRVCTLWYRVLTEHEVFGSIPSSSDLPHLMHSGRLVENRNDIAVFEEFCEAVQTAYAYGGMRYLDYTLPLGLSWVFRHSLEELRPEIVHNVIKTLVGKIKGSDPQPFDSSHAFSTYVTDECLSGWDAKMPSDTFDAIVKYCPEIEEYSEYFTMKRYNPDLGFVIMYRPDPSSMEHTGEQTGVGHGLRGGEEWHLAIFSGCTD